MPRRKNSAADDLMGLIAMLPWWAGMLLAAVSYVVLHGVAAQPISWAGQPGQVGTFAVQHL